MFISSLAQWSGPSLLYISMESRAESMRRLAKDQLDEILQNSRTLDPRLICIYWH